MFQQLKNLLAEWILSHQEAKRFKLSQERVEKVAEIRALSKNIRALTSELEDGKRIINSSSNRMEWRDFKEDLPDGKYVLYFSGNGHYLVATKQDTLLTQNGGKVRGTPTQAIKI